MQVKELLNEAIEAFKVRCLYMKAVDVKYRWKYGEMIDTV